MYFFLPSHHSSLLQMCLGIAFWWSLNEIWMELGWNLEVYKKNVGYWCTQNLFSLKGSNTPPSTSLQAWSDASSILESSLQFTLSATLYISSFGIVFAKRILTMRLQGEKLIVCVTIYNSSVYRNSNKLLVLKFSNFRFWEA